MILPIITIPNPILKKKSLVIKNFDQDIRDLVFDMQETLHINSGVGLAAPQIGKNVRLIIVEFDPQAHYSKSEMKEVKLKKIPLTVLINPKIVSNSNKKEFGLESCLSCPGIENEIERYTEIKVLAQNLSGEKIKLKAKDYFARVIQHEIDHLDGILITDKVKK